MPPQTRSQRRRQAARQQSRPSVSAEAPEYTDITLVPEAAAPAAPIARSARTARRVLTRAAPEPVDYSADYAAAGRDLRWIALWAVLMFGAMIALKFSGLV